MLINTMLSGYRQIVSICLVMQQGIFLYKIFESMEIYVAQSRAHFREKCLLQARRLNIMQPR